MAKKKKRIEHGYRRTPLKYGSREDYNFKDLEMEEEYIVVDLFVDKRENLESRKRLKLIGINRYYLTFISKQGVRECFQNHVNIIGLRRV